MEGLGVGGFVGFTPVLSGAVTVSVLVLGGGEASPGWAMTGVTVACRNGEMVPGVGFIVRVGATYLTAEAAAATLRARFIPTGFLAMSTPPSRGAVGAVVMLGSWVRIGSRGGRFGLYVSASLHCFLMYLQ